MKTSRRISALLILAIAAACATTNGPADGPHRPRIETATVYAQRDIIVNGMRLRYIDEGVGPPVILLPGLTSRIEEYEQLVAALRGRFRVLAFDFPGSGYSDKPDREYSIRFYENTVLGFMDALGLQRCALGGGSLGGNLALRLANDAPERFTRIAAWSPAGAWEPKPVLAAIMRTFGGRVLFWPVVRIQSDYWYSEDWKGKDAAIAGTFTYYREVMSPAFVRMYWDLATEQVEHSLSDISRNIRQPTLLIWGDRDHGFGIGEGIRRLHQEIPRSTLIVFPGTGHAVSTERTEELAKLLDEFFSHSNDDQP